MILFYIQGKRLLQLLIRNTNSSRTTGFTYLVKKLVECEAIDSVHDITIGYPAGLIQGESDLADGKMPKEGIYQFKIRVVSSNRS